MLFIVQYNTGVFMNAMTFENTAKQLQSGNRENEEEKQQDNYGISQEWQ